MMNPIRMTELKRLTALVWICLACGSSGKTTSVKSSKIGWRNQENNTEKRGVKNHDGKEVKLDGRNDP